MKKTTNLFFILMSLVIMTCCNSNDRGSSEQVQVVLQPLPLNPEPVLSLKLGILLDSVKEEFFSEDYFTPPDSSIFWLKIENIDTACILEIITAITVPTQDLIGITFHKNNLIACYGTEQKSLSCYSNLLEVTRLSKKLPSTILKMNENSVPIEPYGWKYLIHEGNGFKLTLIKKGFY